MPYSVDSPEGKLQTGLMSTSIYQDNWFDNPLVTLTLRTEDDEIGNRTIILNSRSWSVKIGRGSQTEESLRPQFDNAWFGSRVMSRAHAVIKVDPDTREVILTDSGSMHGTYVDGQRLQPYEEAVLVQGKVITFGADIMRGELTYQALQLKISYQWSDEYADRMQQWQSGIKSPSIILDEARSTTRKSKSLATKNSYSLYYSDDEPVSDHEIEIVHESVVQPKRDEPTYASKLPEAISDYSSGIEEQHEDSAPTSPAEEHVAKSAEVSPTGPQPQETGIITREPEKEVILIEEENTKQSDELEHDYVDLEASVSGHNHNDILIESSDASNSADEDEGYAELDNFSELISEQDWDDHNEKAVDSTTNHIADIRTPNPQGTNSSSKPVLATPAVFTYPGTGANKERPLLPNMHNACPARTPFYPSTAGYAYTHYGPTYMSGYNPQSYNLPTFEPSPWWGSGDRSVDTYNRGSAMQNSSTTYLPPMLPGPPGLSPSVPAKVSITDILAEQPTNLATGNKRKRDTDHIDQSDPAEKTRVYLTEREITASDFNEWAKIPTKEEDCIHQGSAEVSPTKLSNTASAQDIKQVKTPVDSSTHTTTIDDLQSEALLVKIGTSEDERPQKRARTQEPTPTRDARGTTLIRYAATAIVGAAIGSVGTIFGLAALPADYFL